MNKEIIDGPLVVIERRILLIRGIKVMLDSDLADLYGVSTSNFNLAVKRNHERFPQDFMFQLDPAEYKNLILQFETSSLTHGGRRKLPYVFTEHGVAMLSSVLRSKRAIHMNIFIIRAFIRIREMLSAHKDLAYRMEELERAQKENAEQITAVYSIVKRLINEPKKPKGKIGFGT